MRPSLVRILSVIVLAGCALHLSMACSAKNEAIVCSSDSTTVGAACTAKYNLCDGGVLDLDCSPKTSDTVECKCIENGTEKSRFPSDDACKVTPGSRRDRARNGCKWTLD
jgi:hypothetical protein